MCPTGLRGRRIHPLAARDSAAVHIRASPRWAKHRGCHARCKRLAARRSFLRPPTGMCRRRRRRRCACLGLAGQLMCSCDGDDLLKSAETADPLMVRSRRRSQSVTSDVSCHQLTQLTISEPAEVSDLLAQIVRVEPAVSLRKSTSTHVQYHRSCRQLSAPSIELRTHDNAVPLVDPEPVHLIMHPPPSIWAHLESALLSRRAVHEVTRLRVEYRLGVGGMLGREVHPFRRLHVLERAEAAGRQCSG